MWHIWYTKCTVVINKIHKLFQWQQTEFITGKYYFDWKCTSEVNNQLVMYGCSIKICLFMKFRSFTLFFTWQADTRDWNPEPHSLLTAKAGICVFKPIRKATWRGRYTPSFDAYKYEIKEDIHYGKYIQYYDKSSFYSKIWELLASI